MGYVALYREWRPKRFSEIVGQEHISRTLQNAIKTNRIAHAYLLCGPRGTGKTTSAKVFAKALNCLNPVDTEPCNECENCRRVNEGSSMDVMEIDAASNRGIDEIRDLREKVKFAPTEGKYRVYIIDEVHMLTTEAFNALLKTLEEPPGHVIFILATTEPHKIPVTVLSRCQRFDFRSIGIHDIVERLEKVVHELAIEADKEALNLIARAAEGGMRDALSLLDQSISFGSDKITLENVNMVLGTVDSEFLFKMAECIAGYNVQSGLELVDELVRQGKDVKQFARDLTYYLRNLLMVAVCGNPVDLLQVSQNELDSIKKIAAQMKTPRIIDLIELFNAAEREAKWTSQPRLVLELAVIKACEKTLQPEFNQLQERISHLEQLIAQGRSFKPDATETKRTTALPYGSETKAGLEKRAKTAGQSVSGPDTHKNPVRGVCDVDIKTVRDSWQDILQRIKKVRMSARAFLLEGTPEKIADGCLVLTFPPEYGFHKDKVEQQENRAAIEQVIKDVTGSEVRIKCKFNNEGDAGAVKSSNQREEFIEEAAKWFGGDVLEIED